MGTPNAIPTVHLHALIWKREDYVIDFMAWNVNVLIIHGLVWLKPYPLFKVAHLKLFLNRIIKLILRKLFLNRIIK